MKDLQGLHLAVIGAGLAGVAAARGLIDRGAEVTVLEKSRGYGGRCATKRWEGQMVDHGAQYWTQRDERFAAAVKAACGDAALTLQAPVFDPQVRELPDSGRWYHRAGNSRLVRDLAHGLEVRTETTVEDACALLKRSGGPFDQVISTAPWPQTARMMGVETSVTYVPCLAVVLAYETQGTDETRRAYAFRDRVSDLSWSACENHKMGRISDGTVVIVTHLSESFSREHLERPPAEYPELVRRWVEERWQLPASAFRVGLGHRWRLARVPEAMSLGILPHGCHYVGDAISGSRVEDAWLAGHRFGLETQFES